MTNGNAQQLLFDLRYTKLNKSFFEWWLDKLRDVNDFKDEYDISNLIEIEKGNKVNLFVY